MSETLWQQLKQQGLVSGDEPVVENDNAPWYVRTMLGIAGWFGALFLLGAIFSGIEIFLDSSFAAGILGICACLVAVLIYRIPSRNDFLEQFAFAISLAGQSLVVFSILRELDTFEGRGSFIEGLRILSIITICLQTILFFAIPNYLHRIWSSILTVASLMFLMNFYGFYPFTLSILLGVGVALWLQEFNWAKLGSKLTSPAYALVFVSVFLLVAQTYLWPHSRFWSEAFGLPEVQSASTSRLFALSCGVVLLGLVLVLLKRAGTSWFSVTGIASVILSVLAVYIGMYVPGITVGIILVILGFAHSNRVLTGLGLVILVVFVFQFYYQLDLTLLIKSGLLVASGLVLLVVRQLMNSVWPAGEDKHA
jgi:hypothetical protein